MEKKNYHQVPSHEKIEKVDAPGEVVVAGKGLKRKKEQAKRVPTGKRIIFGKGSDTSQDLNNVSIENNPNIYLELSKLKNNNILCIKYKCNKNIHPNLLQQRISQNLSDII